MHSFIRYRGKNRPWLLLVHGMLSNARHWLPNIDRLGRSFNLVRVDLPGHGRSQTPDDPATMTADSLIERLDQIRDKLGVHRWYLCGQSFGAGLTLGYARRYPDRVIAQCFTNARVVLRDNLDPAEKKAREARLQQLRQGGIQALRTEPFHPRFARRFPPGIRQALSEDADRIDLPIYCQILAHVMPALSLRHAANGAPVVPTLLINGRHERIFQPVRAELEQLWPHLEIADLDGGHSVNIENPNGFAQELENFFVRFPSADIDNKMLGKGDVPPS